MIPYKNYLMNNEQEKRMKEKKGIHDIRCIESQRKIRTPHEISKYRKRKKLE